MKIDLFGAPGPEDHLDIEFDADEVDISQDDFTVYGPLKVVCDLHRSGDFVRAEGTVHAVFNMRCAMCLESYRQNIEGDFTFVARRLKQGENVPEIQENEENEEKINEEDLIFLDHDKNSIDITEFIRDAFLLAVPSKPVCSENCKGLCPVCGHNLNEGDCACEEKRIDPRWQSLSRLINDISDT